VSEEELAPIEHTVNQFIYGNIEVPGKDYCDMSKGLDARPEDFNLVNAMLPRVYQPSFAGNIFEQRCESISKQLLGDDLSLDFDQILAKKPTKKDAGTFTIDH
jgi:phytanoyl-CoA hydroxylase